MAEYILVYSDGPSKKTVSVQPPGSCSMPGLQAEPGKTTGCSSTLTAPVT